MTPLMSREGNIDKFRFNSASKVGSCVWLCPTEFGIVFSLDVKTGKISVIKVFDDERVFTENLVSGIINIEEQVIFIPGFAKHLHIYNKKRGWLSLNFRRDVDSARDYIFAGIFQNEVYMISRDGQSIYAYDYKNEAIKWINNKYAGELSGVRINCCDYDEKKSTFYVATSGKYGLVTFEKKRTGFDLSFSMEDNNQQFVMVKHNALIHIPVDGESLYVDNKRICNFAYKVSRINAFYVMGNKIKIITYNGDREICIDLMSYDVSYKQLDSHTYSGKVLSLHDSKDFGIYTDFDYRLCYEDENGYRSWELKVEDEEEEKIHNLIRKGKDDECGSVIMPFKVWVESIVKDARI